MNRIIPTIVGIFILIGSVSFLKAQTNIQMVSATKITKYYKGRIDDISDIVVSLTCEGKNCKGDLTYLRSKDQFQLQGIRKGDLLQLREFNKKNKCTGYLNGKIEGTSINLSWKNITGTIGNTIRLTEVARKSDFPTFCGDNKWINVYRGKIKEKEIEMILQRVDNNRILGQAYFKSNQQRVLIKGELSDSDNLHLIFFDENTLEQIGALRGVYKNKQNISASFYNNQNLQSFVAFELEKSLAVSCLEYADYFTNYDFLFPKSNSAVFNEVMIVLTKDWIQDCRMHIQHIRKKPTSSSLRASQRAYSWTDIELLNDDFISGLLTYHSTWSKKEKTKTFNFDFSSGNLLELADIFKKGFDYQTFIKKYIAEEITKSAFYKNEEQFRNWIKTEEFPFFTLGKKGISFFTEFHIIYDRQRILIPYKKLKSHIRKNSSVRRLMK